MDLATMADLKVGDKVRVTEAATAYGVDRSLVGQVFPVDREMDMDDEIRIEDNEGFRWFLKPEHAELVVAERSTDHPVKIDNPTNEQLKLLQPGDLFRRKTKGTEGSEHVRTVDHIAQEGQQVWSANGHFSNLWDIEWIILLPAPKYVAPEGVEATAPANEADKVTINIGCQSVAFTRTDDGIEVAHGSLGTGVLSGEKLDYLREFLQAR